MDSEDNYLMDQEALGNFIDELIRRKYPTGDIPGEVDFLKRKSMKELDDQIGAAIFGSLTDEQDAELNRLLDQDPDNEQLYQDFFERIGLDLEKITSEAMENYAKNFLGGKNV